MTEEIISLDGQVKLFDLRSADQAIETWKPHKTGLASFDVHNNSGVFASYVIFFPLHIVLNIRI